MAQSKGLACTILFILAFLATASSATPPDAASNGWRLVRTANPRGGPDAVSMIHTADLVHSDPDFAGLMLRCAQPDVEILIVVITPFPPGAHPDVTINAGANEWHFTGRVIPPGAELLLPPESGTLARSAWQSARELAVRVSSPDQPLQGVVPIDGMAAALATLMPNCPVN